ncbi:NUDIX domain-containing protein [Pseudoroseicyclus tamaricis]|uniref:8-oxo-dGTP diphosphatase n=1 Tax=Pseudoroseicyclus tamaricis TaxID=2705421 RepID=A0A6B2JW61_9RHOB|nr:NUDIX domain-containing protein [Pseudoroseicyclus tamaricis]NDV02737.1 NUDIX domain-containing protein [Pseudoroseicyclus tamaricis]
MDEGAFDGAKGALFLGERLVVLLRDAKPWINSPNLWDFPGGEREPGETPVQTLTRETREELGLDLGAAERLWQAPSERPRGRVWFFVHRLPEGAERAVRFGDEGQGWALVRPEVFFAMRHVPFQAGMLRRWLAIHHGAA